MDIVIMLILGAAFGWLVSLIFAGKGLGLFGNIISGLLGSVLGYWLWGELGISISHGMVNTLLSGISGAFLVLAMVNLVFPGRKLS